MKPKLLGCLAATAMVAAIVVATPAMAFRGGGGHGFGSGGHMMSMGGGWGHGPMFAGRSMAKGSFDRAGRFDHFHHFRNRFVFSNGFNNFAFFGVPFAYDYAAYGNGCWRRVWTPYGWRDSNICYDYGY